MAGTDPALTLRSDHVRHLCTVLTLEPFGVHQSTDHHLAAAMVRAILNTDRQAEGERRDS